MQTLHKPKGIEGEPRKSSTCQPGNISKYSDILLVEQIPSLVTILSPPLFTVGFEDKVLAMEGGLILEFTSVTDTGNFLLEGCCSDLESGTRSPPLATEEEEEEDI